MVTDQDVRSRGLRRNQSYFFVRRVSLNATNTRFSSSVCRYLRSASFPIFAATELTSKFRTAARPTVESQNIRTCVETCITLRVYSYAQWLKRSIITINGNRI